MAALYNNLFCLIVLGFNLAICSSPGKAPWRTLNDGRKMPAFGLGTWLGFGGSALAEPNSTEVQKAVEWAIKAGYRHIDTASIYNTETQVGDGIRQAMADNGISRDDIFVTTKLWNDAHARTAVVPTLKKSLETLGLDCVDLYLIHWPIGMFNNGMFDNTDYVETWKGMIEARDLNLTRSIGVSNFNKTQLEDLISRSAVKPAVLQVEINLNLQQPELLAYCKAQDILVTGYTPFGTMFAKTTTTTMMRGPVTKVDDAELVAIATKHNKTVPQITLKYLMDLNVVPIPKSVTKSRIEQNIDIFDFELDDIDRATLKGLDKNYRTIAPAIWLGSPYYPFDRSV